MSLQYFKKEVRDEVDFLHVDKYPSFLQVDFNTFGIKAFYKVILSLLLGMIKHSQYTKSNKSSISSQYLIKEVRNGVRFLHADKQQSFYRLGLLLQMEVARYLQSTNKRKLVIFLEYILKVLQLLLCSIVIQNIQIFYGVQSCLLLLIYLHSQTIEIFCMNTAIT